MPTWNKSGTVSRESLIVGEWTELYAVVDGTTLRIGCVKSGKLNIRRKYLVHRGMKKFGTVPDRADCEDVRMTFEGRLDEVHRANVLFLLNRLPDEAPTPAAGDDPAGRIEIPHPRYPAQFFTLYGRRPYAETGDELVFVMWKCRSADYVQLATIRDGMRFKAVALNDKHGDYGGNPESPYGWIFGYDASVTTDSGEAPLTPDPEDCWWTFHGPGTGDRLALSDPALDDFNPAINSNDFSIAGVISPDVVVYGGARRRGIFTKSGLYYNTDWALWQNQAKVWFLILGGGFTTGREIAGLIAGAPNFVGGVYEYSGVPGNTSYMKAWANANTNSRNDAGGPVQILPGLIDVVIGSYDHDFPGANVEEFDGDIYWMAYYNRCLTDGEMDDLRNKIVLPWNVPDIYMYINFCKPVAATYQTEVGEGPNAPYVFNVFGAPTKNP